MSEEYISRGLVRIYRGGMSGALEMRLVGGCMLEKLLVCLRLHGLEEVSLNASDLNARMQYMIFIHIIRLETLRCSINPMPLFYYIIPKSGSAGTQGQLSTVN